jgi:hypothetical protein
LLPKIVQSTLVRSSSTLAFDRNVGAYPGETGLPACEQWTGTDEGRSGELEGETGAVAFGVDPSVGLVLSLG